MRIGDPHPTSSKIGDALKLTNIDTTASYLKQGEQLISNFGYAIWTTGSLLFGSNDKNEEYQVVVQSIPTLLTRTGVKKALGKMAKCLIYIQIIGRCNWTQINDPHHVKVGR